MAIKQTLPIDLVQEFDAFETIDLSGIRYVARPVFVPIQEMRKSIRNTDWMATDGSMWRIEQSSPQRRQDGNGGHYAVFFSCLNN